MGLLPRPLVPPVQESLQHIRGQLIPWESAWKGLIIPTSVLLLALWPLVPAGWGATGPGPPGGRGVAWGGHAGAGGAQVQIPQFLLATLGKEGRWGGRTSGRAMVASWSPSGGDWRRATISGGRAGRMVPGEGRMPPDRSLRGQGRAGRARALLVGGCEAMANGRLWRVERSGKARLR